jgi:hypothetical protein
VLVVAPGPRLDAGGQLLDVQQMLPAQLPRRAAGQDTGTRALLVRLLTLAFCEAGLTGIGRRGPTRATRTTPAQRTAARRWLLGELDHEVPVPCAWCCDVLGIDAATLARADCSRARAMTPRREGCPVLVRYH